MKMRKTTLIYSFGLILFLFGSSATAQTKAPEILAGDDLKKVVPSSFYYLGQTAPTQTRNSAAVRFGANHFVIVGLVDTSGYSSDVAEKYEGFIITDAPVVIGGQTLGVGAFGFGFSKDGKMNVFDLSGKEVLSAAAMKDNDLKRPRPLMMMNAEGGVRLYKERNYVVISAK